MGDGPGPRVQTGAITAGAVVLAVGFAMLLDTTGAVDVKAGRLIGPFVLIAIGASIVLGSYSRVGHGDGPVPGKIREARAQGWFGGVWLVGLGCWILISQANVFGLTFATSWPLLLILVGALIAIRGWR
ncbi:MAG TPA: hypothetical protein VFK57_23875 [Vicinamibacterales bacterium]|nr:hypothetical protein [Vicinamibacterales bacterium]